MPHVYPAKYLDMVPALKDIRVAKHQIPPSGSGSELNWYDGAETPAVAIGTPADNATQQVIECKCTVLRTSPAPLSPSQQQRDACLTNVKCLQWIGLATELLRCRSVFRRRVWNASCGGKHLLVLVEFSHLTASIPSGLASNCTVYLISIGSRCLFARPLVCCAPRRAQILTLRVRPRASRSTVSDFPTILL
jgi:hypothetical protein